MDKTEDKKTLVLNAVEDLLAVQDDFKWPMFIQVEICSQDIISLPSLSRRLIPVS